MGGAGRPGPTVEITGGGVENWGTEVPKAEEATGGGAGASDVAIVETVAEGTTGRDAEVMTGDGSEDTPAGKAGEYVGEIDKLGVARGLDKASNKRQKKKFLEMLSCNLRDSAIYNSELLQVLPWSDFLPSKQILVLLEFAYNTNCTHLVTVPCKPQLFFLHDPICHKLKKKSVFD